NLINMSFDRPAMTRDHLKYRNSEIHFISFGRGDELLVCLHGFGDRANMFLCLEPSLSARYTVYALDLPYHGQTHWVHDRFHKEDIIQLIRLVQQREPGKPLSMMGFSYGGRIVQSLLQDFEQDLQTIYLLAPDGIETKWMFNAYLVPQWFRYVIRSVLKKPEWFITTVGSLRRSGIISKFVHDFAVNHIITKDRRDRIFCMWLSLNDFKLQKTKVKRQLKDMGLPVYLFFGKRDEVIPPKAGEWLAEGLPNARLFLLDEGHLLVDQELNERLKKILQANKKSP
ncbi:MAG: alpha/beta hydrolase, partial [Bacteroidota bacterium]